jgi:hypothetical protein
MEQVPDDWVVAYVSTNGELILFTPQRGAEPLSLAPLSDPTVRVDDARWRSPIVDNWDATRELRQGARVTLSYPAPGDVATGGDPLSVRVTVNHSFRGNGQVRVLCDFPSIEGVKDRQTAFASTPGNGLVAGDQFFCSGRSLPEIEIQFVGPVTGSLGSIEVGYRLNGSGS